MHGPADALAYGVKVTGCTLFVVDGGVDTGPIVDQRAVRVHDDDTVETLHERIKVEERADARRVGRPDGAARATTVDGRRVRIRHRPRLGWRHTTGAGGRPPGSERRGHRPPGCPLRTMSPKERPLSQIPIRRPIPAALVSVYDKTGLDDLVRGLHDAGVALVSTGGSAARIESLGIPVTKVEDLTGFPECLDGRVKTLHPKVHAGILADRRLEHPRRASSRELGIEPFDLVVSNLYPFTQTVASGATPDECVEQIDIGGPSMVRAAAKNHPSVAIVTSPASYDDVLAAVAAGGFTLEQRQRLAAEAFAHTAAYDVAVASWMGSVLAPPEGESCFPEFGGATFTKVGRPAVRREPAPGRRALRRRHRRAGRGRAAARQGDVLQQLRRHRRRAPGGVTTSTSRPWRSSSTPTRAASPSAPTSPRPTDVPTSATRCRRSAA